MMRFTSNKSKLLMLTAVFVWLAAAVSADVNVSKSAVFHTSTANSWYNFSLDFNSTSIIVNSTCMAITGGIYAGSYCYNGTTLQVGGAGGVNNEVNIWIYDEHTDTLLSGVNVSLDFVGANYAASFWTNNGSKHINSLPGNQEYTIRYDAVNYRPREYYYYERSAVVDNLYLYMINDSISDLILLTVLDQYGQEAKNLTVKLQRNYISTANVSQYKDVSMMRTNFEGVAGFYVELYDVWYKYVFLNAAGSILKTTTPTPFYESTVTETVNTAVDKLESFRLYDNVWYDIDWVNTSGTIYARLQYSDSNNIVRKMCLDVDRISVEGMTSVCYNCSTASSGTISCILDTGQRGTYVARGWLDTDTEYTFHLLDDIANFDLAALQVQLGREGVFLSIIIMGTMACMGLATVTGSIIMMLVGLVGVTYMGFMAGTTISIIIWLFVLGMMLLFIIYKVKS